MSKTENGRLGLHGTVHSKCNHLITLDFKGLMSLETILNGLRACCRLFMPISILLQKVTEVAKIAKNAYKAPNMGSRSFKVIEFGTNRKGIYDFLSVVTG